MVCPPNPIGVSIRSQNLPAEACGTRNRCCIRRFRGSYDLSMVSTYNRDMSKIVYYIDTLC